MIDARKDSLVNDKIKASKIEFFISADITGRPYWQIRYYDLSDCQIHVGFGSYDINNLVIWYNEYFEFVNKGKISDKLI
jgi:hypothetical protein